jgi:hypothetical protein
MGGAYVLLLLLTLSFFCLPTIHATSAQYPASVSGSNLFTMAIQTRTSNVKAQAAKADVPAVIHKTRRKTRSSSQSPTGKSVTAHLAALNLPGLRFDGALTILGQENGRKDHDDGRDPAVPAIDTPVDPTPPDSPVGVEDGISATPIDKPAQQVVRIADDSSSTPAFESPSTSTDGVARGSALKNPSPTPPAVNEPPTTRKLPRGLEQGSNYVIDRPNKLYIVYDENGQESRFHVEDFVGLFPSWPIIELSIIPTGNTKDERMTNFVRCFAALLAEIKHVDASAAIAPINIYDDDKDNFITDRASLPDNFTKLGKWLMISGGSWVFDKKGKGNGEVYARFRLKSQDPADEIITRVSFEFNRLGGSRLSKKSMQAMETETPMMLLFVCNGTDHSSITTDVRQLLDLAYQDIEEESMLPEEYENRDIPRFAIRLNVPRLPEKKSDKENKAYDHLREQGKKAFHLEVAKHDLAFFTFLATHAHRMGLDTKYFGKFAKLTATLGRDAPLSDCARLRRCIQGHLNFHLSSTSIAINGIDDLDASEIVRNPTTGVKITRVSLRDMLYKIVLSNKSPLFLQLSQRPSGEVDAVIPNTPEAENLAERINVQVAAWCHFYWKDTNKGGERFFKKLSERAFNGHLIHEISECTWDAKEQAVTSPRSLSEMSAVYEFESLDWVQNLVSADPLSKKKHVDPTAAFNFEEDFSVGTIHGRNEAVPNRNVGANATGAIDVFDDDEVSVISSKTQDGLAAVGGIRVATGSTPPVIGLTADATPAGATGPAPVAAEGSPIPSGTGQVGSVNGRPGGK